MAIYHLSTKPISRSSGRSAVASVAYRAGIEITDERLGKTYDYTKRGGVLGKTLRLPNRWKIDRAELWNLAEKTETRSNSRTAREIVINVPHELTDNKHDLAVKALVEFTRHIIERYGVAVDIAYHAPDKQGDNRNYHAHLLLTTRRVEKNAQGQITLGKKSQLEMSNTQLKQAGLPSNQDELKKIRKTWADIANKHLELAGTAERIDHRSHADRGLLTLPTVKMGWQATELERQGIRTDVGDQNQAIRAYNKQILQIQSMQKRIADEPSAQNPQPQPVKSAQNLTKIGGILPKSENLVQDHHQNTLKNARRATVEPRKKKNGTMVAPTPKYTLKTHRTEFFEKLTPKELINRYLQRPVTEAEQACIAKFDPCLSDFDHKRTEIENQFKLHEVNGLPLTIDNPVQILLDDVKDLAYLHAKATLLRENAMDDPHLSETLKAMYERLDHPSRLELANGLNNQGNNQQRYTAHALNALKYLQQIENTYQTGIKSEFVEKLSSRQKELTHSNKYLEPLRYQPKQIDQENQNQNIIKPFTPKPF